MPDFTVTKKKPKTTIFSLRLTPEERADLSRRAGSLALGEYIRLQLFGMPKSRPKSKLRRKPRSPIADQEMLAKLLAKLGQLEVAKNLGELVHAARSGSVPLTPETDLFLRAAHREILTMKKMLMKGLGIKED